MAFTWFDKFTGVLASVPDPAQRDELAAAIVAYGAFGEERELAYPLSALFMALREDIDNSKEMRGRGGRGGRPPKPQPKEVSETQKPMVSENEKPQVSETQKPEVSENEKPEVSENQKPQVSENKKPKPIQAKPNQAKPKEIGRGGRAFTPPSVEEVDAYRREKGYGFDAEAFVAYYAARGWKLARGTPMRDWRAACTTWQKNEGRYGGGKEQGDDWADMYR